MGIDTLAQVLAMVLAVVGFVGIVMVVAASQRGNSVRGGVLLAVVGILGAVVFFIAGEGLLVVGPTERAVVFNNLTGELENPREPGLHIIIPGIQQTFIYRVSRQEYTMSGIEGEGAQSRSDAIEARSIDGQEVFVDITIIFTIDPENVNTVHRNWSDATQGYVLELIRPTVRSITRDVIATARAEEIFGSASVRASSDAAAVEDAAAEDAEATTDETDDTPAVDGEAINFPTSRAEVQQEIERLVTNQLAEEGFTVIQILLREINFSEDFIQAIEQRQVAELERDRASIVAETVRIEAEGRAQAAIETARGEAEAVRINAQAEAEALRLVSEQIAANPNLVQYLYVTTLSDNVNIALVPSTSPFLFDASSFTQMGDDFTAPPVPTSEPLPETDESSEDNSGSGN